MNLGIVILAVSLVTIVVCVACAMQRPKDSGRWR